ncbi:MAG: glycosyltransferase [Armatimonadetes bacterium]|nr:glycosyltransferase [Armatimonadota bacterium]
MTPLRVLLCPAGSAGDVHPFIGLGRALCDRGHDVTVITSAYFDDVIRREGLHSAALGTAQEFEAVTRDRRVWHPHTGFIHLTRHILPLIRPAYETLVSLWEPGRTVVLAPLLLAIGARIFAEAHRVPLATVHLQPMAFLSIEQPPHSILLVIERTPRVLRRLVRRLADWALDPVIGPEVNRLRREAGLPPVNRILTQWAHSRDRIIGLFPEWFAAPAPDWPPQTRLTGFVLYDAAGATPMPEGLAAFLKGGDRPIVFAPGSANRFGGPFLTAGVEACRELGRRGVLLTRHTEQVPRDLPASVRHFPYAPFSLLLPRAAALVHHGGIGTAAQGLAAGIPHLVMPTAFDQPDNARRLAALGVGRVLPPRRFRGPAVAGELEALLASTQVADRCRDLAQRIAADDPIPRTCELIEDLVQPGSL